MGLHIEIDGGASLREWTAVGILALAMAGQEGAAADLAAQLRASAKPAPAPAAPAPAVPAPPIAAAVPQAPTTPSQLADALIAQQEAMVAGGEPLPPDDGEDELPTPLIAETGAGPILDAAGIPHDNRIHAATKTKTKEGTWRYLRGVDKDLVRQVEAELKRIMALHVPSVPARPDVPAPPPSGQDGPTVTDPAAAFGGNATGNTAVPAPPATPAIGAVPPPPIGATVAGNGPSAPSPASPSNDTSGTTPDFARFMVMVVGRQKAGLTTEMVTQIAQQLGLTSIRDLANRPDLIPAFEALLP